MMIAEFVAHNLAPIMFVSLVATMLLGYPVAFILAANGLVFFFVAVELAPFAPSEIVLDWILLNALPERVFGIMSNEVLLAIPFFTFMGMILERSGMAEDLLDTFGQLFGTVRGGVAYAVIFVGTLLAATTGVVAASVISMGLISLPVMLRYGYDPRLSTGTIMASGTLAQILPPSTILIVLADQLGTSVGDMYSVAMLPALALSGSFVAFVFLMTLIKPGSLPGLPPEAIGFREPDGARGVWQVLLLFGFAGICAWFVLRGAQLANSTDFTVLIVCGLSIVALFVVLLELILGRFALVGGLLLTISFLALHAVLQVPGPAGAMVLVAAASCAYVAMHGAFERSGRARVVSAMTRQVALVLVPPVLLIFLVLGTIFIGLATPIEAGALGAVGSVLLALFKRRIERNKARLNFGLFRQATESTAKLCAFILFVLIGARVFALTFYGVNGHVWVEELLTSLPGGERGFLLFVIALIFVLGCFLDFFEIAFIAIPLLVPAAKALEIDPLLLGLIIAVTLQTSFLTPPLGFSLFFMRSVAPERAYADRVTGKTINPVSTRDIYIGGLPFIVIQIGLVALILFMPEHFVSGVQTAPVMGAEDARKALDALSVPQIAIPSVQTPSFDLSPKSGN